MRCHVSADRRTAGFTFAELLAAMVFVGILLPVVLQGLGLARRAAAVAHEKSRVVEWADSWLQERVVTGDWDRIGRSGSVLRGARSYEWTLDRSAWTVDSLEQLRLRVGYQVLGRQYEVRLATLAPVDS